MSHYDTLQVAPWAEDAVVRAAYRALMRLYHPDTNHDTRAELRVREIAGAFEVLGDPAKRAAYDALPTLGKKTEPPGEVWFVAEHSRPPMRNLGVASVALALALSLAVAVWPESGPRPTPQGHRTVAASSETRHAAAGVNVHSAQGTVAGHVNDTRRVTRGTDTAPVLPPGPAHDAMSEQSNGRELSVHRRESAQILVPKTSASAPIAADRTAKRATRTPAVASCSRRSSKVDNGECRDDRQAQIESAATGFLRQSMEHADWQKQELLLSARNRSAFSRALCRSNDCVTEAYLRQIRETTEIMEGRIPSP